MCYCRTMLPHISCMLGYLAFESVCNVFHNPYFALNQFNFDNNRPTVISKAMVCKRKFVLDDTTMLYPQTMQDIVGIYQRLNMKSRYHVHVSMPIKRVEKQGICFSLSKIFVTYIKRIKEYNYKYIRSNIKFVYFFW